MTATPRSILVPTDFSAGAERALRFALRLAGRFDSEVHLLHVRVPLEDPLLTEGFGGDVGRMAVEADEAARQTLASRAAQHGVAMETHLVRRLVPAEAICESAAALGCDLVAIAAHGHRGLKERLLGSVTDEVVRTSSVPVLTVREDVPEDTGPMRRILVPHDFSERSVEALQHAAAWARGLDAELHLLHVIEPVVYPDFYAVDLMPQELMQRIRARAEESLRSTAERHLAGIRHIVEVRSGRAAATIVAEAAEDDVDLVVMGTHGLTGLEHVLLGSVTETVVRTSPAPVLTVRAG